MYNLQGSARKRVENSAEFHLPDEIVIDILSRLPAKDVLRCRCVCRKWRNLTSNRNRVFVDLHIKFGVPMILAEEHSIERLVDPFLLDNWWETTSNRSVIRRFGKKYIILFSHNGLIVSEQFYSDKQCSRIFIIFNPINGENVKINLLEGIPLGDLDGVYFHPLLKEYCTLWGRSLKSQSEFEHVEYRVLNLGSKPRWKTITNPWNKNHRNRCIAPVFIDLYLYWVVEAGEDDDIYHNRSCIGTVTLHLDIIEFDIVREELKMTPCPVPGVIEGLNCNVNLLNIEGCLSLVQIIISDSKLEVGIHIWTLKDRVQQAWKCSDYRINLDLYQSNFQFRAGVLQAICAANGKLAIQSDTTLFVCNLERGTIRIVGKKEQTHEVFFYSHLMSFASLKNCKSNIYMDEKGEVDKEENKCLVLKEKSNLNFSISKESDKKDDPGVDNEDSSSSDSGDSSSSESEDSSSSDSEDISSSDDQRN